MKTSKRELLVAVLSTALIGPIRAGAETYGFTIAADRDGKLTCRRNAGADAPTPNDAVVVKLERPAGAAQQIELAVDPGGGAPSSTFTAQPGATATRAEFKILKTALASGPTLFLRDARDANLRCPAVPLPAGAGSGSRTDAAAAPRTVDVDAVRWWQTEGAERLNALRNDKRYPSGTRFLVHFANGDPAPPFPSSVSERDPVQVAVIAPADSPLALALSVTSCESIQPFRIREQKVGAPQAGRLVREYVIVPYGPLLRCGAGALAYTLDVSGASQVQSLRVRPVYHLAFTVAYGFDFTGVPSYSVEGGKVARTTDRGGLGLRLGFTWFPLGIDYEDMNRWNYVNPVLAFDPAAPTENFLVGGAITPTGGLAVLVGANFRRIPVPKGVEVGGDITGTDVPTEKRWSRDGIGLYLGLSVDDDVFEAMKGRVGR